MAPFSSLRDELIEQSGSYLPRLVAVFYAVFDEKQGPKIVSQVPEGSIATALSTFPSQAAAPPPDPSHSGSTSLPQSSSDSEVIEDGDARAISTGLVRSTSQPVMSNTKVLFDFASVLDFVIPKPELCGHLVTKATRTSKILGFPTRIFDEEKYHKDRETYARNAFLFNVCFVFERDAELSSYEPLVRKTGRYLRMMEESVSLLSSPPPGFQMDNLIEQIYMDLNAFSEASISLHDSYLDLYVLPYYANPKEIKLWDVPIAVTPLQEQKNGSWDVTLYKLCTFIDGINHVKKIAELAEVDQALSRLSIQHLLFYQAIIIVDIFQFSNCYAPVPGITDIVQYGEEEDEGVTDLRAECEAYVYTGTTGDAPPLPFSTLLALYAKLSPSVSVSNWMDANDIDSFPIDVRRMMQFGVIKGFLRRVYAYPVWLDHPSFSPSTTGLAKGEKNRTRRPPLNPRPDESDVSLRPTSSTFSSFYSPVSHSSVPPPTPPTQTTTTTTRRKEDAPAPAQERTALLGTLPAPLPSEIAEEPRPAYPSGLPYMLDGKHHTDEICIKYGMSFKGLEGMLRAIGGVGTAAEEAKPDEDEDEDDGLEDGRRRKHVHTSPYGRVCMIYV